MMENKTTYVLSVLVILMAGWMIFSPKPDDGSARIDELENINATLELQKDSLKEVAHELRVQKQLYLDSAESMDARLVDSENMRKRLIVGYEKILSDIGDMSATEHSSFYSGRYSDND
jgi:hypothetical protein